MTCSNGSYNPNPLANPFNTRLGPSNYTLNPHGQGRQLPQHAINRSKTSGEQTAHSLKQPSSSQLSQLCPLSQKSL